MGQEYQAQYISTIGIENKKKVLEIDGKQILVKVWDTAGQERFGAIAKRYYKGADGILLVYDITSQRKYFDRISNRDIQKVNYVTNEFWMFIPYFRDI